MSDHDLPPGLVPPAGFELSQSRGGFTTHNGPVFEASTEDDLRSGLFILDRHCNSLGFLHGGMASAFADRSLAIAVSAATRKVSVTLKLTMHFHQTVRLHQWLEARPQVLSIEADIVQVGADLVIAGDRLAARVDATFKTLRRPQKQG
ncbi:MAG: PaaI family thioesterase [Pseudomonadota bacterium]